MNDKVLIVDDDPAICKLLEKVMHSNDLDTDVADCGVSALSLLARNSSSYALVLLDVMLGDMEGFEVIKQMRSQGIKTPVIIVSGRSEDYDSLYGLSIGADDYITKPFRPLVLGAKVKALIRRNKDLILNHSDVLECGPFSYHSSTMRFYRNGEELTLSARESAILLLFLRHPNQVFTKEMIYEQVWGNSVIVDDNAIMVYINRLRSKIEDDKQKPRHIVTVRGLGYRFVPKILQCTCTFRNKPLARQGIKAGRGTNRLLFESFAQNLSSLNHDRRQKCNQKQSCGLPYIQICGLKQRL